MPDLLAWIEQHSDGQWVGAFIATRYMHRMAARRSFGSRCEARRWVEHEAAEFDASVQWTDVPPRLPVGAN